MTSEALTTANALMPGLSASFSAASFVLEAVIVTSADNPDRDRSGRRTGFYGFDDATDLVASG
jgi:hypothetical protein